MIFKNIIEFFLNVIKESLLTDWKVNNNNKILIYQMILWKP